MWPGKLKILAGFHQVCQYLYVTWKFNIDVAHLYGKNIQKQLQSHHIINTVSYLNQTGS